ncbi:MAG: S-methyl-5-thioribose-1-phosphate isomerase [Deltaproteobacteria bacterium]|nr:MAG: S-methyl-5-thioribose-1-phosphate isomerase [Deltaproteobacteria bacterium]
MSFKTIEWIDDRVIMIDQRKLPLEESYVECNDHISVAEAIRTMVIRGAPAIGVAAAMGIALGGQQIKSKDFPGFFKELEEICEVMRQTRPTAVNLFWAIERMKKLCRNNRKAKIGKIKELLKEEALKILEEDEQINRQIGIKGRELIEDGDTILTHCNAGALATAGYGTALGVIRAAYEQGKRIEVYADETRPVLQGARLTTWELNKIGIPVILITDSMAAYFMKKGKIKLVIVGADRITRNGDVANKIGTYGVAVLARHHKIPFYVAAPVSTFDFSMTSGEKIPIEEREGREVIQIFDQQIAPDGVRVMNPAFDVTSNRYITAIITEKGIARPPYGKSLRKLLKD